MSTLPASHTLESKLQPSISTPLPLPQCQYSPPFCMLPAAPCRCPVACTSELTIPLPTACHLNAIKQASLCAHDKAAAGRRRRGGGGKAGSVRAAQTALMAAASWRWVSPAATCDGCQPGEGARAHCRVGRCCTAAACQRCQSTPCANMGAQRAKERHMVHHGEWPPGCHDAAPRQGPRGAVPRCLSRALKH